MRTVKSSEFKARCLKLVDEVGESGEPILITRNDEPVAELRPARRRPKTLFGLHAGQAEILGDIISPLEEPC
jgi:prevent-host-death family protein